MVIEAISAVNPQYTYHHRVSCTAPVVRWANQIHESPSFITVLREGFNCGWIEAELVKIAFDHVKPTGAWGSSGSFPAERAKVEVQDSPR